MVGTEDDAPVNLAPCVAVRERRVTTDGLKYFAPTLAWTGSEYGLLWAVGDTGSGLLRWMFARLDKDGTLLGSPATLSTKPAGAEPGGLFWVGDGYVATILANEGAGPGVYLFHLDPGGVVVGAPRLVAPGAGHHAFTRTDTDFALPWMATGRLRFVRLDAAGDVTTAERDVTGADGFLRISWSMGSFAVVWGMPFGDYFHLRLGPDGTPVGDIVKTCCGPTAIGAGNGGTPAVAATPTGSLMAWVDAATADRPVTLTTFDRSGGRVGDAQITAPAWTRHPVLATGGREMALAWQDDRLSDRTVPPHLRDNELYVVPLDVRGTRLQDDLQVTHGYEGPGGDDRDAISLIPTPSGYAMAWSDNRDAPHACEIYFAAVNCATAEPLTISCPAPISLECATSVGVPVSDPAITAWRSSAAATGGCSDAEVVDDAPAVFPASCAPEAHGSTVTFVATDDCGNTATCSSSVTVVDTTMPSLAATLLQGCLWSPHHDLVEVGGYTVEDACDPAPATGILACSDEAPASEPGSGGATHCPDAVLRDGLVLVRAERSGTSGADNGRVYTRVALTAADRCGNQASTELPSGSLPGCPGVVCVPHDQHPRAGGDGYCEAVEDAATWDATSCDPEARCP